MGDSFTEGVGDPDPSRPNGWRGWADRVAEALAALDPEFRYANLAVRGRKLKAVIDEQLPVALTLEPDLAAVTAGTNDLLRPRVDLDAIAEQIEDAVGQLRRIGATVILQTIGDAGNQGAFAAVRGRVAILNEHLRRVAYVQGAVLVDNWRLPEGRDMRYWAPDRLHLGPAGHQGIAINTLDSLGVAHNLKPIEVDELPVMSATERRRANLEWGRTHLVPWLHRRLTGRSSGDGIEPKRPALLPIEPGEPESGLLA
jgi:lysophospholipase L1-like esterase